MPASSAAIPASSIARAVGVGDQPRRRLDVGAVHGSDASARTSASRCAPPAPSPAELARQPLELGRERAVLACSSLASSATSPKRRAVARHALPQRGQCRLAGRVDEQRADVVEELVADGPADRPVAQALVATRGSSPPRRAAHRGRAAASGTRPGRPARRDDRSAARRRGPRAPATAPARACARTPRDPPGAPPPGRRCRRTAAALPVAGSMSKNRSRSAGSAQ